MIWAHRIFGVLEAYNLILLSNILAKELVWQDNRLSTNQAKQPI